MKKEKVLKTYKGFDKNLKCRDFQYEIGKEFETDGAKCCQYGFHACEYPLDCFGYYSPAESRFCEVEQSGVIDKDNNSNDSKIASSKIKIGAELDIAGIIKASINFIKEKATKKCKGSCLRLDSSVASNSGDSSVASNSGYRSVASNSGDSSVASNSGNRSVASNSGDSSVASNSGDRSVASNSGYRSVASNSGYSSVASNSGDSSVASNSGNRSVASNSGDSSVASNSGDRSVASNSGYRSVASNSGYSSVAEVTGNESIACSLGVEGKAKGKIGCWLVVSEWDCIATGWHRIDTQCIRVDGKTIKEDTFYLLKNGKFIEVKND